MKKNIYILLAMLTSFVCGYGFNSMLQLSNEKPVRKVTGIGGIFFKCKDPKQLRLWYERNLGFSTNAYGAVFEWRQSIDSTQKGFTQWSPFKETTQYFAPSTKEFMINYRVVNLEQLLSELKLNQVQILDTVQAYDYGKFVHIMDPEGNKIELWQPNDLVYDQMGTAMGYGTIK